MMSNDKDLVAIIPCTDEDVVDEMVKAVNVALDCFPNAKIKSVEHINSGTRMDFEKPAERRMKIGD